MTTQPSTRKWRKHLLQRRISAVVDQLRPQRWNWTAVLRPLDDSLTRFAAEPVPPALVRNLRFFWLDGLFASISEHFYLGFVVLYALAYGATAGQVGLLTAVANLLGVLALFPGARLVERMGRRKPVVVWSGGGVARIALLLLALFPLVVHQPGTAVFVIIVLEGIRAFTANLANPAWTAIVADLVPPALRGRYLGSRNIAMGIAALLVAPLAGYVISRGNAWGSTQVMGYQTVFLLAFISGIVSTAAFQRIAEPAPVEATARLHHRGDLRRALRAAPWFKGLVASTLVWNFGLQIAAPFFNVYLVERFQASATTIGLLAAVSSLTALLGQPVFGRLLDKKGALWVQQVCGFVIPVLPVAWIFITAPWQVGLINALGGFVWGGYNLSNFNLLLVLTPETQRPRAVALYQTAVFGSAVLGPLLGGYLADAVGFHLVFGLSGAFRLLGMVLFVLWVLRPYRQHSSGVEVAAGITDRNG